MLSGLSIVSRQSSWNASQFGALLLRRFSEKTKISFPGYSNAVGKKLIPLKVWEGWVDAFREEIKVSVQKGYHKRLVKHASLSLPSCENVTSRVQTIFRRKGRPTGLNTALESHGESPGLGVPDGRASLWQQRHTFTPTDRFAIRMTFFNHHSQIEKIH